MSKVHGVSICVQSKSECPVDSVAYSRQNNSQHIETSFGQSARHDLNYTGEDDQERVLSSIDSPYAAF